MKLDPKKQFRGALRDALNQTPNQEHFPSVMKSNSEQDKAQMDSLMRESTSDTFFMEEPRNEYESRTHSERD